MEAVEYLPLFPSFLFLMMRFVLQTAKSYRLLSSVTFSFSFHLYRFNAGLPGKDTHYEDSICY